MSAIFISHRSTDDAEASAVRTWLAAGGHRSLFLDFDPVDGIPAGVDWEQELYRNLRISRAVIVICSTASMASKWVFAEITQARALGKHILPLKVDDCEIPGILRGTQVIDRTKDPEHAFARLESGLKAAGIDPNDAFDWDPDRSPYPGLQAFDEQDAAVYFGRGDKITEGMDLLNRVRRHGTGEVVMVLGASGSGKSSLVRAGIIPRLRRDTGGWLIVGPMRPQDDPFAELARSCSRALMSVGIERERLEIRAALKAWIAPEAPAPGGGAVLPGDDDDVLDPLSEIAEELLGEAERDDARALLVIDQADELLGFDARHPTHRFLRLVRAAAERKGSRLIVIGTMRSDLLGSLQSNPALADLRFQTLTVGPLTREGLIRVIERPATLAGIEVEPGLSSLMVRDAETEDALPLLAFTLRQLNDKYGDDGKLTIDEYTERLGGLGEAVASAADGAVKDADLDTDGTDQLRRAFLSMVRLTEEGRWARKVARYDELPEGSRPALDRLVDVRLLVRNDGAGTIEVAHESLFRSWGLLSGWLDDDREALRFRRELQGAAARWHADERSDDDVWRGTRVGLAVELLDAGDVPVGKLEREFVAASVDLRDAEIKAEREQAEKDRRQAEKDRVLAQQIRLQNEKLVRRTHYLIVGLVGVAVFLVAALGASVWAITERDEANTQRARAVTLTGVAEDERDKANAQALLANSRQLASSALGRLDEDLDLALLLGSVAHEWAQGLEREDDRFEIVDMLVTAANTQRHLSHYLVAPGGHHVTNVNGVSFSPDGDLVASGSVDGTVIFWDPDSGRHASETITDAGGLRTLSYSPTDPELMVTGGCDRPGVERLDDPKCVGVVMFWDLATGERTELFEDHDDAVVAVTFTPDGEHVASASRDGTVRIRGVADPQAPAVVIEPLDPPGRLWDAAFDASGDEIAVGYSDGNVHVYDATTGDELRVHEGGHTKAVASVAYSPDGKWLVSGGWDRAVSFWDLETGASPQPTVRPGVHGGAVLDLAFIAGSDGLVASGFDGAIILWDTTSQRPVGSPLQGHTGHSFVATHPSDETIVVSAGHDRNVIAWDLDRSSLVGQDLGGERAIWSHAYHPDGDVLALGTAEGTIELVDANTLESVGPQIVLPADCPVPESVSDRCRVRSVAFSPDGRYVASRRADGAVVVSDLDGHHLELSKQLGSGVVMFSTDGARLATRAVGDGVVIWDLPLAEDGLDAVPTRTLASCHPAELERDGDGSDSDATPDPAPSTPMTSTPPGGPAATSARSVTYLQPSSCDVRAGAFSRDGSRFGFGDTSGQVIVWRDLAPAAEARDGPAEAPLVTPRSTLITTYPSIIGGIAFLDERGERIVIGTRAGAIEVREVGTTIRGELPLRADKPIWSLDTSSDGRYLAAGLKDGTIALYDMRLKRPFETDLLGHDADCVPDCKIRLLTFDPARPTRFASSSSDGETFQWDIDGHVLSMSACTRADRRLTLAEQAAYLGESGGVTSCERAEAEAGETDTTVDGTRQLAMSE